MAAALPPEDRPTGNVDLSVTVKRLVVHEKSRQAVRRSVPPSRTNEM